MNLNSVWCGIPMPRFLRLGMGAQLFVICMDKLADHYRGAWSPLLFHQNDFDGDTVLAAVGFMVALAAFYPGDIPRGAMLMASALALWKVGSKFIPKLTGGWFTVGDIFWCADIVFCSLVLWQEGRAKR